MHKNKIYTLLTLSIFLFTSGLQAQNFPQELSLKDIFDTPYLPGTRPSFSGFSPDGKTVFYRWSEEGNDKTKLYKVSIEGGDSEEVTDDNPRFFEVDPYGSSILYTGYNEIKMANSDFSHEKTVVVGKKPVRSPKWNSYGNKFAYIRDGDIWISGALDGFTAQLTEHDKDQPGYSLLDWKGNYLLLQQWDSQDSKEYYFPEYAGKYVKTGATRRGISNTIISIVHEDSSQVEQIINHKGSVRAQLNESGTLLALDIIDPAQKERKIVVYDMHSKKETVVFEDATDGWLYNTTMSFAPKGNKLMFQSEKDGWNHIYTVNANGSRLEQHTFGEYDIPWARWIDENTIVMANSQYDPGEIQLYTLDLNNNLSTKLTVADGYRKGFTLSNDKKYIVYSKSYFNEPFDLYAVSLDNPKNEIKLTNTVPDSFYEYNWEKEDYVRFTGRDGKTQLSMSVLPPVKRNPNGNPVIVFVHGAGSLQNVYQGWSDSYWREYMFHQLLINEGYYVIEVDYRHSTGYGRKFREDVTNWMGKFETEDIEDGLAFLADNYDKADTSRVGIYGGSYGGFMALYTVSTSPERFHAAAALRAVTNWENYYYTNPHYTLPRLGAPDEFPEHYEKSNPLTYADSLQRPVLILHGLIDNNVGFQDAAQYVEKLIKSGNDNFEMMMYPTERHAFTHPKSWYDEYRRIHEFFEKHIKNAGN